MRKSTSALILRSVAQRRVSKDEGGPPKSDLPDFGKFKRPDSGKPEAGWFETRRYAAPSP